MLHHLYRPEYESQSVHLPEYPTVLFAQLDQP